MQGVVMSSGQLLLSRSDEQNLLQTQIQTSALDNPSVSVRGSQLLQGSLHVPSCCLRVARQLAAVMLQTPSSCLHMQLSADQTGSQPLLQG